MSYIELLFVIIISSIILLYTIHPWKENILVKKIDLTIQEAFSYLYTARTEAINHATGISLCPIDFHSSRPLTCTQNWAKPWVIFLDPEGLGILKDKKNILHVYPALDFDYPAIIRYQGFQSADFLHISPDGFLHNQNGMLIFCVSYKKTSFIRALIINKIGRIRIAQDEDHDGVPEDGQGKALKCPI